MKKIRRRCLALSCAGAFLSVASYAQLSKPVPISMVSSGAAATVDLASFQIRPNVVQGLSNRADLLKSTAGGDITPSGGAGLGAGSPGGFNLVVYPGYLSNPNNKPTLHTARQHPVYINSPTAPNDPAHWGNPQIFLDDLAGSSFIHLVDQYTLDPYYPTVRYPLGTQYAASGPLPHFAHLVDIIGLLHNLALQAHGYNDVYHIFLPQGQDYCFDAANTQCYSPDNRKSFAFCAFHSAGTFNDAAGHVIFSLEPYQQVNGCQVTGLPSPNGQLMDSTASVLSHELFEMITDPDLNAYVNRDNLDLYGYEIGDQCQSASANFGFVMLKNFHFYEIQSEYSNFYNGCTFFP